MPPEYRIATNGQPSGNRLRARLSVALPGTRPESSRMWGAEGGASLHERAGFGGMTEHEQTPGAGASGQTTRGEPSYVLAAADGAAARRRGEPRDPAPYLARYRTAAGEASISPEQAWLAAYDRMDALLAEAEAQRARRPRRPRRPPA